MMSWLAIVALFISAAAATTVAQPTESAPTAPEAAGQDTAPAPAAGGPTSIPAEITLDAYDAVREGNRLLRAGHAKDALRLYEHADQLQPEAREIAFAEGLSRYALGDYDQARESFQRVSLGQANALADDAIYSEGASHHAEALSAMDNPQLALSQLENAMQRYQTVLANRPEHEAARDANYKAAHAWRQIKQMMQDQQQQQQQPSDKQNDEQEQQEQDQQQNQQQQDQNDQQQSPEDQQQQQEQQSDQSEQQQSQQQEGDQQQQDEQQQQQAQAEQEESEQPQPLQQEQDVSREQAERKLREMMQAQRQRQKNRKKQRVLVPVRPTEKDW